MTKDLANISQCLEAQAFLRNPIEEWTKVTTQLPNNVIAKDMLSKLSSVYEELDKRIAFLKTTR